MTCEHVQQLLAARWELPEGSDERRRVEGHVAECPACAELFRLWEASNALIRDGTGEAAETEAPEADGHLAEAVMNRIYAEQRWAMPAIRKTYAFSYGFRLRALVCATLLLVLFVTGFGYSLMDRMSGGDRSMTGVLETAHAFAAGRETEMLLVDVPVASLNDTFAYYVTPSAPEYWVALSLFGAIAMLLVLNWLNRVRA